MSAPQFQPSSGPPPAKGRVKSQREDRAEASRPPAPLPLEPIGAPVPHGMAWPPPAGDPTVCQVRDVKGREVTTKCGRLIKIPKADATCRHASIWTQDVTCKRCRPE